MRVLAALSGGVDSAVAAARAVDAGHEVTGVHLALAAQPGSRSAPAPRGCCTLEDARDARRAADVLGIPFYVWDLAERFRDDVVDDFVAEYAAGRTPNPCLRCNERIKFAAVLDRAVALGFDAVCTGHYARVVDGPTGRELHRAVDRGQGPVVRARRARPPSSWRTRCSRSATPPRRQVRAEAADRGLAVAAEAGQPRHLLHPGRRHRAASCASGSATAPGPIVDADGEVLGEHDGAYAFTVGQRKGLRLGRPAADGRPRYVLSISPVDRHGDRRPGRAAGGAHASRRSGRAGAGAAPDGHLRLWRCSCAPTARSSRRVAEADGDRVVVPAGRPGQRRRPGQAVVLYDGTRVVGSATITATAAAVTAPDGATR